MIKHLRCIRRHVRLQPWFSSEPISWGIQYSMQCVVICYPSHTIQNRSEPCGEPNPTRYFPYFSFCPISPPSAGLAHVSRGTARTELHVRGGVSSLGCTVAKGFVGLILSFVLRSGSEILPYAATHNPTCAICAPPKANHELHTSPQSCALPSRGKKQSRFLDVIIPSTPPCF